MLTDCKMDKGGVGITHFLSLAHRRENLTDHHRIVLGWSMHRFVFFLLVWVCCIRNWTALSTTANIPVSEMSALFDLYNATNGDAWHWFEGSASAVGIPWNFSDPANNNPCVDNWQGIECTIDTSFEYYHVSVLSLYKRNLTGTLPASVSTFQQLQIMLLYTNQITGRIPESLGDLPNLQIMYLYENYIEGTIPETLGSLVH